MGVAPIASSVYVTAVSGLELFSSISMPYMGWWYVSLTANSLFAFLIIVLLSIKTSPISPLSPFGPFNNC